MDEEIEELLVEKMPEVLEKRDLSFNRFNHDTAENKLFHVLYEEIENPGAFESAWRDAEANNNARVDTDADDGCYTFLQLACDRGMLEVASFLLKKGADPNKYLDRIWRPLYVSSSNSSTVSGTATTFPLLPWFCLDITDITN